MNKMLIFSLLFWPHAKTLQALMNYKLNEKKKTTRTSSLENNVRKPLWYSYAQITTLGMAQSLTSLQS